ncbi:hypothetical protein ACTFIV_005155, partial [Dictyostelium citrinum]
IQH